MTSSTSISSTQQLLNRHLMAPAAATTTPSTMVEELASDSDKKTPPRLIACTSCAKAKTRCDRVFPSCGRCTSKGLCCVARTTKRCSDAAFRHARKQLSLLRRPVSIASAAHPADHRRAFARAQSWDHTIQRPLPDSVFSSPNMVMPTIESVESTPYSTPQLETVSEFGTPETISSTFSDIHGGMSDDGSFYNPSTGIFMSSPPTTFIDLDGESTTSSTDFMGQKQSPFMGSAMFPSMPYMAAYPSPMPSSFADSFSYAPYASSLAVPHTKSLHQRSQSVGATPNWYPAYQTYGSSPMMQPQALFQNW